MIDAGPIPLGWQPLLSDCVIAVALYSLLFSIPVHFAAHILLFVGKMRKEHIERNVFHRAFEFCEKTIAGHVLLGLALFSPTLTILGAATFLCLGNILDVLIVATLPWVLSSLTPLVELKLQRRCANGHAIIAD
jgi:hypothetical protein